MAHAEICPVCKGKPLYEIDPETGKVVLKIEGDVKPKEITCRGCGGKGWIVIPDETVLQNKPIVHEECPDCKGIGEIIEPGEIANGITGEFPTVICETCNGMGDIGFKGYYQWL